MIMSNSESLTPKTAPPAIGYAIREQNRPILDDLNINAAEITFERADDPLRIDKYIRDQDFDHVSVHALKLSPASAEPPVEGDDGQGVWTAPKPAKNAPWGRSAGEYPYRVRNWRDIDADLATP